MLDVLTCILRNKFTQGNRTKILPKKQRFSKVCCLARLIKHLKLIGHELTKNSVKLQTLTLFILEEDDVSIRRNHQLRGRFIVVLQFLRK